MIVNGQSLLRAAPIKDMIPHKVREHGVSHGLGEAGYDIRIKQKVEFSPGVGRPVIWVDGFYNEGNFTLASTVEEFDMPSDLVGVVHDKSTWARQGLSVFNTVIEPGWCGFLTLELVYHRMADLVIPAGAGIAQVVFTKASDPALYDGKYQGQGNAPIPSKFE